MLRFLIRQNSVVNFRVSYFRWRSCRKSLVRYSFFGYRKDEPWHQNTSLNNYPAKWSVALR